MTKSQNTKNEQQKDLCITSEQLTEQWKKGELPEGFYYVNDGAEVTVDYYLCDYWERHFGWDVQQVIAPVPTFNELQNMNKAVNECMAANIKLVEENAQLKELLKKCSIANTALVSIMDRLRESTIPEQRENCEKLFEKTQELQKQLDEALK